MATITAPVGSVDEFAVCRLGRPPAPAQRVLIRVGSAGYLPFMNALAEPSERSTGINIGCDNSDLPRVVLARTDHGVYRFVIPTDICGRYLPHVRAAMNHARLLPTATTIGVPATGVSPVAWFTGEWFAHTLGLTFDRAGHGTLGWRTYNTCGTDPPPCDTFHGNVIDSGGHATLLITKYSGTSASGQIVTSTDPAQFPVGPFSVRSAPNGMLTISPSPRGDSPLCGPKTPVSVCPY